jgi:hypothetical protein
MSSDFGVRVRIRVNAEVATLTRANLLAHIAREIFAIFSLSAEELDLILFGIQEMLLEEVALVMYDSTASPIGYLAISIDWGQFAGNFSIGNESRSFTIDPELSIIRQISPLLERTAQYILAMRRHIGVSYVEPVLLPCPGKEKEAEERLKLAPLTDEMDEDLRIVQAGAMLKVTDSRFNELSVEFRYLRSSEGHRGVG